MKCILHTIKSFDLFGPQINFTIKGETNFKTVFGGLVSVLVYGLYLFFFVLFGKDMIYKLNPTVSLEQLLPEQPENYTIDDETFFAWRISNFWGKSFNRSLAFDSSVSYEVFDNNQFNITDYKLFGSVSCKGSHYESFFHGSHFNSSEWMCFDFKQLGSRQIFGTFESKRYSFINFQLQICDLDYENDIKKNCKDFKQIKELVNRENLLLHYLFFQVDFKANNYTNPLQKTLKNIIGNLNLNFQKSESLNIRNVKVEQDEGILFPYEKDLTNLHYIYPIQQLFTFRNDEELEKIYSSNLHKSVENVFNLYIYNDPYFSKYSRKYMKIQDVFGNVNGFMEFFILVISVITLYTNYRFEYYLFNKFVDVKVEEQGNRNIKNVNYAFSGDLTNNLNLKEIELMDREGNFTGKNGNRKIEVNRLSPNKGIKESVNGNLKDFACSELLNKDSSLVKINSGALRIPGEQSDFKVGRNNITNENEKFNGNKGTISDFSLMSCSENRNLNFVNKDTNPSNELENNKTTQLKEITKIEVNSLDIGNHNFSNEKSFKDAKAFVFKFLLFLDSNKSYLQPSFCNYIAIRICKFFNKKKIKKGQGKKLFDFKLMKLYNDKITSKFDIFYYLKWVRNFKNMKEYLLGSKINQKTFDSLATHLYKIKINESFDSSSLKRKGKLKINEENLTKFLEAVEETNNNLLKTYILNKIKESV